MNRSLPFLFRFLSCVLFSVTFALSAQADCDLRITGAGPVLTNGTSGTPQVGDLYGLKVTFNVIGTANQPYLIKWTLGSTVYYYTNTSLSPGGYLYRFYWWTDLDDSVPWSVTLDPNNVSGDTNLANNTVSGTFTPTPPSTPVELYSPRHMRGSEYYTLSFQPGSGSIPNLYTLFGLPTSHGAQNVISVNPPAAGQILNTAPYGIPVIEIARTNVPAATFSDTNYFTTQLSSIRVNPTLLRTNTWTMMDALTAEWTQWLAPDQRCQSTNAAITNFVQQSLPANYRATLTPYDTARTLHRAVMKKLTYQSPPLHIDAVGVLQDGVADCGGFAALLTASLRSVGIPARCISGFRQGNSVWHVRVEFHLPGVEWLVADPTDGNANDPTGTYAYDFGYVPNADSFFAVDVGDAHIRPYYTFQLIQVPNWLWNGGATFISYSATASLQPAGLLTITNSSANSLQFNLTEAPTTGSVIIQSSSDCATWVPILTNTANGTTLNYSLPINTGTPQFYRAILP